MLAFTNPAGGIGYHLAAAIYTAGAWRTFRDALSEELARRIADPSSATLVVVGSSGGYCLDPEFLKRFVRVVAIDIDPIALALFRWRFRKLQTRLETVREDFFSNPNRNHAGGRVVYLFSNLLGQLEFLYHADVRVEVEARLGRFLKGTPEWISFHDRLTSKDAVFRRPSRQGPVGTYPEKVPSARLASVWWRGRAPDDLPGDAARAPEVDEHELGEWTALAAPGFTYLPWRLDGKRTQLIEICGNIHSS